MKWKDKTPRQGAIRTWEGFLWFPTYIVGEWRWLERAMIRQKYHIGTEDSFWENISWVD